MVVKPLADVIHHRHIGNRHTLVLARLRLPQKKHDRALSEYKV